MSVMGAVEAGAGQGVRPPTRPDNWYLVGPAAAVRRGAVLACAVGTEEIVLMRGLDGRLSAFAAHCAHMGCHLRHGTVDAGGLRCALHRRLIGPDGVFGPPGEQSLRQRTYEAQEAFGAVYVWLGRGPAAALPGPRLEPDEGFAACPVGVFDTRTDWVSLLANGFDMEHLATVHRRRLIEVAEVTRPTEDSFRLSYRSRVIGSRWRDRIVRYLSGNEVHASMTTWRGTMMFVESRLGRRRSFFVLSMCPRPEGGTQVRSVVGVVRKRAGWFEGLRLRLTAWMFKSFLADDFQVLTGLKWHPPEGSALVSDRHLQELARFLAGLPGAEA